MRSTILLLLATVFAATPVSAQRRPVVTYDTAGAFDNAGTMALLNRARSLRMRSDSSIRSYTAIIKSRIAGGMRLPMKDRTMIREENASRVRWSRDADIVVQRIAGRQQSPGGVEAPRGSGLGANNLFDPASDRMRFAFGMFESENDTIPDEDDDYWIEHPLGADAEQHYSYASGDTLTVTLQDGTT